MSNSIIKDKISFKKVNRDYLSAIIQVNNYVTLDLTESKIDSLISKSILVQIQLKLKALIVKNKQHFNLSLTAAEALLFYKVHKPHFTTYNPYEIMAVVKMLTQIEKELI